MPTGTIVAGSEVWEGGALRSVNRGSDLWEGGATVTVGGLRGLVADAVITAPLVAFRECMVKSE